MLINIALPHELNEIIAKNAVIYNDIQNKPAMGAVQLEKHTQYRSDNYGALQSQQNNQSQQQDHSPTPSNVNNNEGIVSDPSPGGGGAQLLTCASAIAEQRPKYRSWTRIDRNAVTYKTVLTDRGPKFANVSCESLETWSRRM